MKNKPVNSLSLYLRFEREAEKEIFSDWSTLLNSYKKGFNAFSSSVDFLTKNSAQNIEHFNQFMIIVIMNRLIGTIQSLRALTLKGYYYEACVLQRNFLESLGLCAYLADNPEKISLILKHNRLDISSSGLFRYTQRIFSKEKDEHLNEITVKLYGTLCDYVHGNLNATLKGLSVEVDDLEGKVDGQSSLGLNLKLPSDPDVDKVSELSLFPLIAILGLLYCYDGVLSPKQRKKLLNVVHKEFLVIANFQLSAYQRIRK